MKRVIDTSEVLGTVEAPGGRCQVCASAAADLDEPMRRLVVRLDLFLGPTDLPVKEGRLRADWLSANEAVTESVGSDESREVAPEIFHRWERTMRQAVPSMHNLMH